VENGASETPKLGSIATSEIEPVEDC